MKKIIVAPLALLACFGAFGQKVNGKLKFQQGQVLNITLQTKVTISQEAMGQSIDLNVDGTAGHSYTVTNSTADNSTLHHEVKRIAFDFEGMGQKQSFDSDKPKDMEKGQLAKPVKEILKKTFDVIVDPNGKVLMLQPEKVDAVAVDERLQMITGLLKDVMTVIEPPVKGGASFFQVLPENELAKGETWNTNKEINGGKTSTTYTLSDITDSTIVVDFDEIAATSNKAQMMGFETSTNMNNKTKGKIILDKNTGLLRRKEAVTEAEGTTEVIGMGGSMPVKSKTITTIEVK